MNYPKYILRILFSSFFSLLLVACSSDDKVSYKIPYVVSDVASGMKFDWSTHKRLAQGSDNWAVTWGDGDQQILTWGDGGGFGGSNYDGRVSLGVAALSGTLENFTYQNLWGGKNALEDINFKGKSYALLMVDDELLMWVSPGSDSDNYLSTQLYILESEAREWKKINWKFTLEDKLVIPAFLQFGSNYRGSRDDYIYVYFIAPKNDEDLEVQKPGEIYLTRVPKNKVRHRDQYEFFLGLDDTEGAVWGKDLQLKQPVFYDPEGVGWTVSVSYNTELKRYILMTEHGTSFDSNLGVFESREPWGPWKTIHYEKFAEDVIQETVFYYNFSNRWSNGSDFVMLFSGIKENDSWNAVRGSFITRDAKINNEP